MVYHSLLVSIPPINPLKYLLHAALMVCVHDPVVQYLQFPAQAFIYKAFTKFPKKTQIDLQSKYESKPGFLEKTLHEICHLVFLS